MATACDTESRMSEQQSQNRFRKHTGISRQQDGVLSVIQDCCTNGAYATNTSCCTGIAIRNTTSSFNNSPVTHHLSDTLLPASMIIINCYHQYVEAVKQKLTENQVGMTQIRLALQFMPCCQNGTFRPPLFSRSSPLLQAEDIGEVFKALDSYTSWFNHGFVTHMATSLLNESGKMLKEDYLASTTKLETNPLAILPRLSSSSECPAEFEQVLVKIEKIPNSFTLQSTLETIKEIAEILGLRPGALLLSGISASAVKGSTLMLWIPQAVSKTAISHASENAHRMLPVGILSITSKYEIITPAVKHITCLGDKRSREVTDSGCDTMFLSNTSEGESIMPNSFINHLQEDFDDFDDVFLTAISSSSSSYVSNNSVSTGASSVSTSSNHHQSNRGRTLTPTLSPLAEKSDMEEEQSVSPTEERRKEEMVDGENVEKNTEKSEVGGGETGQTDPTGSRHSLMSQTNYNHNVRGNVVTDASSHLKAVEGNGQLEQVCSEDLQLMNIMGEGVKMRRERRTERLVLVDSEYYDSSESLYVPMEPAPKVNLKLSTDHHQYVNVRQKVKPQRKGFSYCITKTKPTGFVDRVLIRASQKWPANLHMVSISSQGASKDHPSFQCQLGQRLTGLYSEGDLIVVTDQNGQLGKVPISSCRISRSYYGNRSKAVRLASSKLYNSSTLSIQNPLFSITSNDPYDQSSPINIDMIVITAYQSQDRDEMTVQIGDHLRLLYCDSYWVYAASQRNQAGFIPRENCRLKRRSEELLKHCHWLTPNLPFQSDFVLDMTEPPPQHLVGNLALESRDKEEKVVIMRNYTPPGTSCTFRRGLCVQVLYREGSRVFYVATSLGKCFWIPAAYCLPTLPQQHSPCSRTFSDDDLYSHTSSKSGKGLSKKKVSFAKNAAILIETYRSNPELTVIPKEETSNQYAFVAARRSRSQDSFPPYLQFLEDLSPETSSSCSCFFCF